MNILCKRLKRRTQNNIKVAEILAADEINGTGRCRQRRRRAARPLELAAIGQRARSGAVLPHSPVVDAAVGQVCRIAQSPVAAKRHREGVAQACVGGNGCRVR